MPVKRPAARDTPRFIPEFRITATTAPVRDMTGPMEISTWETRMTMFIPIEARIRTAEFLRINMIFAGVAIRQSVMMQKKKNKITVL